MVRTLINSSVTCFNFGYDLPLAYTKKIKIYYNRLKRIERNFKRLFQESCEAEVENDTVTLDSIETEVLRYRNIHQRIMRKIIDLHVKRNEAISQSFKDYETRFRVYSVLNGLDS